MNRKKLLLYIETVRYLRTGQIFSQILVRLRRVLFRTGRSLKITSSRDGRDSVVFSALITKPTGLLQDGRFCFINQIDSFSSWDDKSNGALWRYNLNYMDFLLQDGMTGDLGLQWIDNFIRNASANTIIDDPYPISLRSVNWIKFMMLHKIENPRKSQIDTFVYAQLCWLSAHTERHLLANHYLENGFSLLWGGIYFHDGRLLQKSERILCEQLDEQILADGGHFELSTMYHCIMLERVLDAVNLLKNNECGSIRLKNFLERKASGMLGWLQAMLLPDGNIPLFNDSAYGIAPFPSELFEYAGRLGLQWQNAKLAASGYRHLTRGLFDLIADVGQVGAAYNAGHAHADTFNYVLGHNGKNIIIDTGTSCYDGNASRRGYERSTSAHNTVMFNEADSSEVWGSFRCGRRANVKILRDDEYALEAEHDGYAKSGVSVVRNWTMLDNELQIKDMVSGNICKDSVSRMFFAPSLELVRIADNEYGIGGLSLSFTGASDVIVAEAEVASGYNTLVKTTVLEISFRTELVTVIKEK